MWTLSQIIGMGMLSVLSIVDIQFRKVPVEILAAANLAVLVYQIMFQREDLWLVLGGVAVGLVFLGISWASRQKVGYGDSWAILILGIFLGLWGVLEVLAAAFLLLTLVSVVLLARKRMSRRLSVPFYPFLAAGYLISVWEADMYEPGEEKEEKRRGRYLQAVFTVEMSVLVPLAFILIMSCILVIFYFHDKNILSAAAYETAVAGSTKAREKDGVDAAELEALFAERIQGKCILFAGAQAGISVSEEEIKVEITATKGGMSLALEHRAAVTEPEKEIRKWRRFIK